MRITGGTFRGQTLVSPKSDRVRPTTDKIRQAIFNVLNHTYDGVRDKAVLDICCGTGALGLEALSHGASRAVFVDLDVSLVRQNVEKLRVEPSCQVIRMDALKYMAAEPFDVVFIDPPYGHGLAQKIFDGLKDLDALFVVETEKAVSIENGTGLLEKTYGDTKISFLKHQNQN